MMQDTNRGLAVSKTLMEAKDKLGAMYYDAKLLECPKNAIELTKLLNNISVLKKEYDRRLSELKRTQAILRNSLPGYLKPMFALSQSTIKSDDVAVNNDLHVQYSVPGFRYHANGVSKVKSTCSRSTSSCINVLNSSSQLPRWQSLTSLNEIQSNPDGNHTITEWLVKERCKIENMLADIEKEIKDNAIELKSSMRKKAKFSYLRAHSNDPIFINSMLPKDFLHPTGDKNNRFSIKPGSNSFKNKSLTSVNDTTCNNSSRKSLTIRPLTVRSNCAACQHVSSFDNLQRNQRDLRKPSLRWKIAPRGEYVQAPIGRHNLIDLLDRELKGCTASSHLHRCVSAPAASQHISSDVSWPCTANSTVTKSNVNELSRPTSAKSLFDIWKPIQCAENANCEARVTKFLEKMDKVNSDMRQ